MVRVGVSKGTGGKDDEARPGKAREGKGRWG